MEGKEIIEGNKLIAEFKGWIHHEDELIDKYEMENLKFHSSWDWLMPIVEKISRIEFDRDEQELPDGGKETIIHTHFPRTFGMLSKDGNPMFRFNCAPLFEAETLIEAVWLAIVDFISSHNENIENQKLIDQINKGK